MENKHDPHNCFVRFSQCIDTIVLPEKFTFPFNYTVHPLCEIAAKELQNFLNSEASWNHQFDDNNQKKGTGKMFGVLVVYNIQGELGYLRGYSGKIADTNQHPGFVPPIFDLLNEDGFFKKEERELTAINQRIEQCETSNDYTSALSELMNARAAAEQEIGELKMKHRKNKCDRKKRRESIDLTDINLTQEISEELDNESRRDHFDLKDLKRRWKVILTELEDEFKRLDGKINALKHERKLRSAALQKRLFTNYSFLNKDGQRKNLSEIFPSSHFSNPPSGAGECAAPKLLQYAFQYEMTPVAMAEFWWGKSPDNVIRRHKHFYPACRSKCEPILGHMLSGIELDENPMLRNPAEGKEITVLYEDESIAVIQKPEGFLSVPGKKITDSVQERMRKKYPEAEGPLVVHRLDMSTSGLMLIAKNIPAYKILQEQFTSRSISKHYVALLDGNFKGENIGEIDLPLRVDLDNRPRQLVCFKHGKKALTKWEIIDNTNGQVRVYFYPVTGRTHQLRVHAAHAKGLNIPIKGDDLYGKPSDRLYLHAEKLSFTHPVNMKKLSFEWKAPF